MRKLAYIFILLCLGCSSDDPDSDCATVLCAAQNLMLQFVSADTGEDVFAAGVLEADNLVIEDIESGNSVFFEVIPLGVNQGIVIAFVGRNDATGTNYKISDEGAFEFDSAFEMEIAPGSACCAQISYNNVQFTGIEGEASNEFLDTYIVQF